MPDEERKTNAPQRREREIEELEAAFQRAATVGDLRPLDLKATLALMVALQGFYEKEPERWRIEPLSHYVSEPSVSKSSDPIALTFSEEPQERDRVRRAAPETEPHRASLLQRARATRARQKATEGTDLDPIVRARRVADRLRGASGL
jgi:hypothetical protein